MSKLNEIISKIAPVLGSIIPLPGASLIMNLIGAAFGGASSDDELADKIASDPNAAVKLREIEENTKVQLQQIAAQQAQAEIAANTALIQSDERDRASARQMATSNKSNVQTVIVAFLSVAISFLIAYLCFYGLPKDSESNSILYMLIGQLSAGFGMALNFFFGTSSSAAKKDDMIYNSTPIGKKQ